MRSYSTQHRGRAVVAGLVIGGFTSAVGGSIAGSLSVGHDSLFSADAAAGVGAIVGGGVGLAGGGLSGLIVGSRDVHELEYVPRVSASVANGQAAAAMSWSF